MNRVTILAGMAACATLCALPQAAKAAGFANTAQSATATAMGGVATANPDEPNATFFNPASMPFRDRVNVYAGPTILTPTVDYTAPDGSTEQTEAAVFPPPNFNLSVPFADNYAVGIGVTMPWGLAITWPSDWVGRDTFISQSLQTVIVNPSFAYKLPGLDLSFAIGGQVIFASLEQERGETARVDQQLGIELGGTGQGFGGTAAIMYRPIPQLTFGVNYRSAVKLNFDGVIHFSGVDGTPLEQQLVDQPISTNLTVPHTINFGVGWQVLEPLFIGLDVNFMTWSTYDRVEVEFSQQSPSGAIGETDPPLVIESNWEDAVAIRLGAQYEVIENLMVRAGVGYDLTPVPAETVGPSLPDNNRLVFGVGAGYTWNSFRADLAYQLVTVEERVIDNGNVDGTYQMGAHIFGLNVGYGF